MNGGLITRRRHADREPSPCRAARPCPQLGLGTWMMGEGRHSRADEVRALQARHRSRHDADRHRRDVRERHRRGDHRRGGQGPARRGLRRLKGAARATPAGRARSPPASAASSGSASTDRPLPPPLARQPSAGRDRRRLRGAAGGRQDPRLGRLQLRCRRHGGAAGRRRRRRSPPTRCSTTSPAAASSTTCCRGRRSTSVPIMAYSPIEQGRLARNGALGRDRRSAAARRRRRSRSPSPCADAAASSRSPRPAAPTHVEENRKAADIVLTADELAALDEAFPPPRGRKHRWR